MRELIERLFGGSKKKDEPVVDDAVAIEPDYVPDTSAADEAAQEPEVVASEKLDGLGVLDQTVIVSGDDVSEQILQATDRVFDDTLPGKVALEDTAVGLPPKVATLTEDRPSGLRAAQYCHIGNVRERNEDSSFLFTAEFGGQEPLLPAGLYIVADGMGGHHAGHEASKNAARLVAEYILERIYIPLLQSDTVSGGQPEEPIGEVMVNAVQSADRYIHNSDPKKSSGTTLTAALIMGRRLYMAHVGDSRAYMLADGQLKLLTTDHSYVRRLQDAGQLTEEEAAVHPQRNMLYKAVGQGGDLDVDTFTQRLPQQGKLFLCSDGLWGLVSDENIAEVINQDISLLDMADELVMMARVAGGHDNITAIIVDFEF
ncbi:MAG: protein phosphatase 2C domain-containing protein [Chloroflexota bacterium]